jgi:hypothetical protein
MNPTSAAVFGSMTPEQLKSSAERLLNLTPEDIDELVDASISDPDAAAKLKETLRNRRQNILDRFGINPDDYNLDGEEISNDVVEEVEVEAPKPSSKKQKVGAPSPDEYKTSDGAPITIGMQVVYKKTGQVGEVVKYDPGNSGYVHVMIDGKKQNKSTKQLESVNGGGGGGSPKAPKPSTPEVPGTPDQTLSTVSPADISYKELPFVPEFGYPMFDITGTKNALRAFLNESMPIEDFPNKESIIEKDLANAEDAGNGKFTLTKMDFADSDVPKNIVDKITGGDSAPQAASLDMAKLPVPMKKLVEKYMALPKYAGWTFENYDNKNGALTGDEIGFKITDPASGIEYQFSYNDGSNGEYPSFSALAWAMDPDGKSMSSLAPEDENGKVLAPGSLNYEFESIEFARQRFAALLRNSDTFAANLAKRNEAAAKKQEGGAGPKAQS